MYIVLTSMEKIVYLAFWKSRTKDEAAGIIYGSRYPDAGFERAISSIAAKGLLKRIGGRYQSDHGYMVGRIADDNLISPEKRLAKGEVRTLMAFLNSKRLADWMEEKFPQALALEKEDKDVLAGFFWTVFRDVFAIAHAYFLVFGDQPAAEDVGEDFDAYLVHAANKRKKIWVDLEDSLKEYDTETGLFSKRDPKTLERAFTDDFVFLFPRELVEYLRWNVNPPSSMFIVQDIFEKVKTSEKR